MTQLSVDITGHGPPLILLHGWAMHGGIFAPLVQALREHHTLHVVDLPGHGHSRDCGVPLQLDACVQAVLELHGVRMLEAGRQLAIQRVGADIGLSVDEGIALSRLHARRNGSTYQSTIPPVSAREAKAAVELLMKVLEKTKAHIAQITAQRGS